MMTDLILKFKEDLIQDFREYLNLNKFHRFTDEIFWMMIEEKINLKYQFGSDLKEVTEGYNLLIRYSNGDYYKSGSFRDYHLSYIHMEMDLIEMNKLKILKDGTVKENDFSIESVIITHGIPVKHSNKEVNPLNKTHFVGNYERFKIIPHDIIHGNMFNGINKNDYPLEFVVLQLRLIIKTTDPSKIILLKQFQFEDFPKDTCDRDEAN